MFGRGEGDVHRAEPGGLPPFEGDDAREAEVLNETFDAPGKDGDRGLAGEPAVMFDDLAQGGAVEVVHVGVRQQDGVDRGQIVDPDAGVAKAAKDDQPAGEDRVDENGLAADLNQKRRMADEGDAQFSGRGENRTTADALQGRGGRLADQFTQVCQFPRLFFERHHDSAAPHNPAL